MPNTQVPTDGAPRAEAIALFPTASDDNPVAQKQRRFLFRVGEYRFLTPAGLYAEMLEKPVIAPLPNSPSCLLGISNIRGNLVPIYQIHSLLQQAFFTPARALLMGSMGDAAAIIIDQKPESLYASDLELLNDEPIPDFLDNIVHAGARYRQQPVFEIHHQTLFERLAQRHETPAGSHKEQAL